MELGELSRRGFVARSLGALGGFSLFAGLGQRANASWSSSSWCGCCAPVHHHCGEPVTCYAPAPTCCAPQPTCCAPGAPQNGGTYEAAPPPEEESPPPPGGAAYRQQYYRVRPRYARRSRYTALSMLER